MTTYFWNRLGYDIFCSTSWPASAGRAQGCVGVLFGYQPTRWSLELTRFHWPNIVSCEVFRGTSRTPIIGAYLPPTTLSHLPNLEEFLERFRVQDPILMEYINMELDEV